MSEENITPSNTLDVVLFDIDQKIKGHSIREAIDSEHKFGSKVLVYLGAGSANLATAHRVCIEATKMIQCETVVNEADPNVETVYLCPIHDGSSDFEEKFSNAISSGNELIGVLGGKEFVPSMPI